MPEDTNEKPLSALESELVGLKVNADALQKSITEREASHRKAEFAVTIRDEKIALAGIKKRITLLEQQLPKA